MIIGKDVILCVCYLFIFLTLVVEADKSAENRATTIAKHNGEIN